MNPIKLVPELFKEIKAEVEEKVTIKLDKILKEKPSLNFRNILSIIFDICSYYEYFPETKSKDRSLFDEFLDIYDCDISFQEKLEILLKINDRESFKRFAIKHYDGLSKEFEKSVFIPRNSASELEELGDFQIKLDMLFKEGKYKAAWWCDYNLEIISELYKIFGENLKMLNGGQIEKYDLSQLYFLKKEDLEELFIYEINNDYPKNLGEILVAFCAKKNSDNNNDFVELEYIIDNDIKVNKILVSMKEQMNNRQYYFDKNIRTLFSGFYNNILREKLSDLSTYKVNMLESVFNVNYLRSLNELESYSKKELENSSLYLKCYKIFLEEFIKNYNDVVTDDILIIVETLFKRVIKKNDIINILSIDNLKSLWHFYKTNEFVEELNIPLDMIKRSNSKQYRYLKKKYVECQRRDSDELFEREDFNSLATEMVISLLDIFGYELTGKIIKESKFNLKIILNFVERKSRDFIEAIKKVLVDGLAYIHSSKDIDIVTFLACFDMLYEQRYINITTARLVKSMNSLRYALLPSNLHIEDNLEKLNLVAKGDPLLEKIEGIKLYDKYRFRIESSIPDISGSHQGCNYSMVDLHSPEIISNGIGKYLLPNNNIASSCLTPNGKAASCLRHGALNSNGRFFKVEYCSKIVAYSWVWRAGDVICFDNIEVTENLLKINNYEKVLFDIYSQVANRLIEKTQKEEVRGLKLVILGRNKIDMTNKYFDDLEAVSKKENELFKPNTSEDLYLKDSSEKQLVLAGNLRTEIKIDDVVPIYKYQRPAIINFSDLEFGELSRRINSIYFDYCLENNKKYQMIEKKYKSGFLGEDWFVGETFENDKEFYHRGDDERLFLEARKCFDIREYKHLHSVNIIRPEKEIVNKILRAKNIEVDYGKLSKYLNDGDRELFTLLPEYYTHHPEDLEKFVSILENNAITSKEYGNHSGGEGCNGVHFISVAKANTQAFEMYLYQPTFVITSDICAFSSSIKPSYNSDYSSFVNSSYPFRIPNITGEYHVLNSINLDKAKAIFGTINDILELTKIVYLQELYGNDLPLVEIMDNSYIDKELVKKHCKLRK